MWAEELIDAQWRAAYRLSIHRGAIVVAEVRLFPAEAHAHRPRGSWSADALGPSASVPRGGVSATLLRKVRPLRSLRQAATLARQLEQWQREVFGGAGVRSSPLMNLPPASRPLGQRPPRVPDRDLRRVATAYRRAFRRDPRRVNELAAVALKLKVVRVRDLVALARQRGFLHRNEARAGECRVTCWTLAGHGSCRCGRGTTPENTSGGWSKCAGRLHQYFRGGAPHERRDVPVRDAEHDPLGRRVRRGLS